MRISDWSSDVCSSDLLRSVLVARPRSEEARQAALDATVDLVLTGGVDTVTFEAVAAESGVAKSTLYRHFGTKQAMVAAAAASCVVEHTPPDTGDLAQDLRLIFPKKSDQHTHEPTP